jgi:2-polyprenyl-6-methoxyphenol hydroxylase-like FAD-dependent oxidoreductase
MEFSNRATSTVRVSIPLHEDRIVVIGSGPSGASAALTLVEQGLSVTLLESGVDGMLNGWNRLHAVSNVVVADASAFTTGPELAGTTLSTTSRTLSKWDRDGIVSSQRERVTILQPHALVSIAEDLPASPA